MNHRTNALRHRFVHVLTTLGYSALTALALVAGTASAAPVCSTGSDGTVEIGTAATRVNVYYAAPEPAATPTVAAGSTLIPIDVGLGPQATAFVLRPIRLTHEPEHQKQGQAGNDECGQQGSG